MDETTAHEIKQEPPPDDQSDGGFTVFTSRCTVSQRIPHLCRNGYPVSMLSVRGAYSDPECPVNLYFQNHSILKSWISCSLQEIRPFLQRQHQIHQNAQRSADQDRQQKCCECPAPASGFLIDRQQGRSAGGMKQCKNQKTDRC